MADNYVANAGSGGKTFASDEISAVDYPRIKLVHGADGTNDGDVATGNPLPVRTYIGTTIMVGGAGAVAAGVLRVTLASDDPAVALLGTIDTDTGNIVTAVQLLDDVVFVDDAAFTLGTSKGVMMMGFAGTQSVDANDAAALSCTTAGALRVNVENTLTVNSHAVTNAGTFAVQAAQSGTWTVDLGATDNAVLDAIAASLAGTLTVGSHAVTNAGTFAVQIDAGAVTSLALIDDAIFTDDAAYTLGTSKGVVIMGFAGTQSVDANDAAALACTTAGALRVNVENASLTVASHAVTNAGTFAVQVDGSALTALQLIDDCIFTDDAAFTPGTSKVAVIGAQADEASTDSVDEGDAGALRMTLDRKLIVTPLPHTAGGCSIKTILDSDETEDDVKTSAGCLYGLYCFNSTNAILYVKLYNATAASTTVGSTTPLATIPVPANNDTDGAGVVIPIPTGGITFDTALCIATTTGLADNDTGAPGANAMTVNAIYK